MSSKRVLIGFIGILVVGAAFCWSLLIVAGKLAPHSEQTSDLDPLCADETIISGSEQLVWHHHAPYGIAFPPLANGQIVLQVERLVNYPIWDATIPFSAFSTPKYQDVLRGLNTETGSEQWLVAIDSAQTSKHI